MKMITSTKMFLQLILLRFFFQPQTNRLETLSFSTKSLNKCPSWSFLLCLNHGLYSRYVLQTDACKSVERNNNLAWGIQKALEANQDKAAPGRLWRFCFGFPFWRKIATFFWISWLWKMNPQKKVANMMKIMMWFEATRMTCYMTWTSIGEWRQACGDLSQIGLGRRRMSSTNKLFIHRAGSFSLRRSGWKRIVTDTDTTYSLIWVYLKIIENPQNASPGNDESW